MKAGSQSNDGVRQFLPGVDRMFEELGVTGDADHCPPGPAFRTGSADA